MILRKLRFPSSIAVFSLLAATALADRVTLRDGSRVEGTITSSTATEIVIDEQVSAGVRDTRTIKMSEVASIQKDAPDELAWAPLKGLQLGANSLPATSYEEALAALQGFQTQYPTSAHAAEARKAAEAFAAEKKRVDEGELKLYGKWLTQEEIQRDRYQINALIAFNYMKEQSAPDPIGALNTFALIEKNYLGARIYPQAVEVAKQLIPGVKADAERRRQALAATRAEREKTLRTAVEPQRSELNAQMKKENLAADQALIAAERQGLRWLPLRINSERSLQMNVSRAAAEGGRLANIPTAKINESFAAADKASAAIKAQDLSTAETELNKARIAWSQNEVTTRLLTELSAARKVAAEKAAAEKLAAAAVKATPAPPKTVPTPPPSVGTAVEPAAVEAKKAFLLTPVGAVTVVIGLALLIGALNAFKSVKSKASEILE